MKINWSGRSHSYSNKDINYLVKIIKTADPLTQGKYLKEFEYVFSKYIKRKKTILKHILLKKLKNQKNLWIHVANILECVADAHFKI